MKAYIFEITASIIGIDTNDNIVEMRVPSAAKAVSSPYSLQSIVTFPATGSPINIADTSAIMPKVPAK